MADESYPGELKYYKEHDWVRVEGDEAVFGISWFAQDALGEIVFVSLPDVGDAVDMPGISDGAFDVVFSNSVIEHVETYENQRRMAAEIRRVGRRYFVQTPNRHFPLEPHFLVPGFQLLPYPL